ncbi:GDSL-type esterase/lipase family protein [Sphingomonas sp. AR_OL41]|uniref:GDSL-type esterase/lipase family protein n=1 Tax=Sphingomonas sp. AR_OL41 TaxID=3042729 RepID=UPI002480A458|nr:GDSL-type esterase/lipase family protein [Sphingomonas sp. AR_OL41]MDH7974660.1 GDSL-type esterase/lipase family protein [Sphingomonas sp. AR_OL41]
MRLRAHHAIIALLCALLAPVALNTSLRWAYEQTVANWLAKAVPPDRVFIGDSLTAGGGDFGRFGNINLGIIGASTRQVSQMLRRAQPYNPRQIVVMAGSNDVDAGTDLAALAASWRTILADKRVLVVLTPHSRYPAASVRIDQMNAMVQAMAKAAGRPTVEIRGLTGPDGLLLPEMTTDGVHLTRAAYAKWREALDHAATAR